MARLKPAATGGVGGIVLRWLWAAKRGEGEILRCAQNDVLRATPTATVCGNGNGMRQWQKHMATAKAYGNGEWAG